VQVSVSVTDAAGHAVKDLQLEDFSIEENGSPVTIAHLGEAGETRLEMVLVFDNTGSVFTHFDFDQQAATDFLKTIFRPHDAVAVLCIGSKPEVLLDRTVSLGQALEGLSQLKPALGATAFYDSVIAAAHMLHAPVDPEARRVQIVLSDGEDNLSERHLDDAIREVQQADCIFYSINPGGPSVRFNLVRLRGQQAMEALAEQTGGVAFLADKKEALGEIYGRIATELKAQYLLSYYSPDTKMDGSFRRIGVGVPKRPELRVRARQGYYATKGPAR
jgi:VWFA-related protein